MALPLARSKWLAGLVAIGIAAGLMALLRPLIWPPRPVAPIGLFTTLPILWNEAPDVAAMLHPEEPPHWARGAIGRQGRLVPLDRLDGAHLARVRRLIMAQPRPLAADENVAVDRWLRGGGALLLLADPMLTEQSQFALGDRRRPQDTILLSALLAHWGIGLSFDAEQPLGEAERDVLGVKVPVSLPGRFHLDGAEQQCRLWGEGLAVSCRIGRGRVIALADAAVIEREDPGGKREAALRVLMTAAFAAR